MRRIIAAVLIAFLLIGIVSPLALAYIDPPESIGIISAHVFQNLAETGDTSIVFYWAIPYPSDNYTGLPPASVSIFFRLMDPTGTTTLQTTQPYVFTPFGTVGYGYGVSDFYFTAADNFTMGSACQIELVESPQYYAAPATTSHPLTTDDWSTPTQAKMHDYFITLCDLLNARYPTIVSLKAASSGGTVLSALGENYFDGAVPNLQILCPILFLQQQYSPVGMTTTPFNSNLQNQYSVRLQGSEIKRGADRIAAHVGLTGYFVLGFAVFIGCIGLCIFTMRRQWGVEPGMVASAILVVAGAVFMGNAVFTICMIGALIAGIAIMFQFHGRRA